MLAEVMVPYGLRYAAFCEVMVAFASKNSLVSALFGELTFTTSKITFTIWVSSGSLFPRVTSVIYIFLESNDVI